MDQLICAFLSHTRTIGYDVGMLQVLCAYTNNRLVGPHAAVPSANIFTVRCHSGTINACIHNIYSTWSAGEISTIKCPDEESIKKKKARHEDKKKKTKKNEQK